MKRLTIIALILGVGLTTALVAASGAREVAEAAASVGWGVLLVVLARAFAVALAGVGWALLFPASLRPPVRICMLLRVVREGVNTLLPLTQLSRESIGAPLLTFYGVE